MLAKEAKGRAEVHLEPVLLKVAGLDEIFEREFPIERMVLDLRDPDTQAMSDAIASLPWAGFLGDAMTPIPSGRPGFILEDDPAIVQPGDVIEFRSTTSRLEVRYRRGDNANVLFATERCNSFCLMCSQPPRDIQDDWRIQHLSDLIDLIDRDEPFLTITGGEPTLLGEGLVRIIERCAHVLPNTAVHVLSNGRLFGEGSFAQSFINLHPCLTWGIPLYGDHYRLHDYVVQSSGAFSQTLRGLYALHAAGQRIEVRVVLVKPTVERLLELSRYLYRNLPFVWRVAFMGIEPTGFAKSHHSELWIDPIDMAVTLSHAVNFLADRGIETSLYNLPLCTLPESLWPYARRSISNWKQDYLPTCESCTVREQCGGFFAWVTPRWTSRAIAPVKKERLQ